MCFVAPSCRGLGTHQSPMCVWLSYMASGNLGEQGSRKKRRRKRGSTAGQDLLAGVGKRCLLSLSITVDVCMHRPTETLSSADSHHGPVFNTKPDNLELLPSSLCDLQLHLPLAPPLTMSCRPKIYQAPSLCASQSNPPACLICSYNGCFFCCPRQS
ncbi:hypothetical protein AUEXF2481DRAFT_320422 [Aureobasidium subglaciale EXF-2481]|uniref:Uncharacterized protein n=1 Tax=Aureobasidium subglaciale (strain EXF-2481) TaxID=1043005 RepID=A0A074Y847_AURSE|nr:uncharacterized protein AUEXF2481DRAFT_320422 [Aureobasidium subglaciale EXF-2481]KEQ93958.1 hypothetical protein AUEXF2481DRAFT_320422 [Aureobasidium subglaciale EXF-2481]